ncbi:hypothetical protein [Undibacterium sp.]|uniref:hypothetical protein n=1 Tax=Undibacterium sp. TaxID=1914977 RepID=UPI0025F40640|nr:hypothetical protein [Undibacterium sp.]
MKSKNGRTYYLIEGLKTLYEVAKVSDHYCQPEPWQFPDFNLWMQPVDATCEEEFKWRLEKNRQHQEDFDDATARSTKFKSHRDTFLDLTKHLFKALKISDGEVTHAINNFEQYIVPKFLKLEEKYPATFTDVAAIRREPYRVLVRRYNEIAPTEKRHSINPENVSSILLRGVALYRESDGVRTDFNKLIWGLALIGCGSIALRDTHKCDFCPRRTLPRNRFCADHSQADASDIGRTKSKQASNYRVGKRACGIAQRLGFVDGPVAQAYGYQIGIGKVRINASAANIEQILKAAEIMFPAYFTWDDLVIWMLREALKKSPRVQELLGEMQIFNSTYIEVVDAIREKLNLFETDEGMLSYSVLCFEKWLECEAQAQPGVRGVGGLSTERIKEAITLANMGSNRKRIAETLGVTYSTITLWTKKSTVLAQLLNQKAIK